MNFKKKMRRGSLAALIALALSSSALAMPTGGEVVRGVGDITVDGGTNFSVINNNATITATNDGQINWNTFNIANGEILNFDIANNKTLVNQVTGDQLSSILGTMNQTGTGKGNVVLINPNGIYVGANAVLNVSDLTLSALSIDKATETERILKAKAGTTGLIDVANGARFTANELSLIGQKVTVADGVVFDLGTAGDTSTKTMLQVLAADRAEWTFAGNKMLTKNITHNAGNDVVFNGKVDIQGGAKRLVEIGGATTKLNKSTIKARSLMIDGVSSVIQNGKQLDRQAAPDRTVDIEDSTLTANEVAIRGGKVTVANNVTFSAEDPTKEKGVDIVAGNEQVSADEKTRTYTMGKGNDLAFHGKVENFGKKEKDPVAILGSKVNLDGARIEGAGFVNAAAAQRIVSTEGANGGVRVTASAGNALSADGAQINAAKDIYLVGGNVALKDGQIQATRDTKLVAAGSFVLTGNNMHASATKDNVLYLDHTTVSSGAVIPINGKAQFVNGTQLTAVGGVYLLTGTSFSHEGGVLKGDVTKNNIVSMWNSNVTGTNVTLAAGGAEVYDHSEVKASNELIAADVTQTDGSQLSLIKDGNSTVKHHNTVDAEGFTVKGADVPPTPEKPVPPAVPDTIAPAETPLSAQDKENIETGKTKARDALVESTQEKRAEALTKTVAQLNEKVGTSRRQTAGVVVGIVQEIANSPVLSDGEKVALVESVLNAYTPVQEAKAEQDNTATNTIDEAVSAATNVSVAPVYPDETEAEETVSFT